MLDLVVSLLNAGILDDLNFVKFENGDVLLVVFDDVVVVVVLNIGLLKEKIDFFFIWLTVVVIDREELGIGGLVLNLVKVFGIELFWVVWISLGFVAFLFINNIELVLVELDIVDEEKENFFGL